MSCCVWLLEGSLGPGDPALQAEPGAPAVFVFDEEWYAAHPIAFQRLFFVYESLVETFAGREGPGEIHRGGVVRELVDFCHKHHADEIHVTRAATEDYRRHVELLRANFVVVEHEPDALVPWPGRAPRRFMDFWKDALPKVLPEESAPEAPREPLP